MMDLQGPRTVATTAALTIAGTDLAYAALLFFDLADPEDLGVADVALLVVALAASLALLGGLVAWTRRTLHNQTALDHPVQGSVWLRAVLGYLLPVVGALFLFQLAARLLDASSQASRRPHHLGAWFGLWVVAYLALDATNLLNWVDAAPLTATLLLSGVFTLLALPGLHRFLRTIEDAQGHATRDAAATPLPEATPFPSE